jgi:hypothetical protein
MLFLLISLAAVLFCSSVCQFVHKVSCTCAVYAAVTVPLVHDVSTFLPNDRRRRITPGQKPVEGESSIAPMDVLFWPTSIKKVLNLSASQPPIWHRVPCVGTLLPWVYRPIYAFVFGTFWWMWTVSCATCDQLNAVWWQWCFVLSFSLFTIHFILIHFSSYITLIKWDLLPWSYGNILSPYWYVDANSLGS